MKNLLSLTCVVCVVLFSSCSKDALPVVIKPAIPLQVANFAALSFNTSIVLNWAFNSPSDSVLSYNIYAGTSVDNLNKIVSVSSNTFVESNLINGTMHYYYITATNRLGESLKSSIYPAVPLSSSPNVPIVVINHHPNE